MLILTRRISESIFQIHPDGTLVKFKILDIHGCQARISIEAPKNIVIYREEIMDRILKENNGKIPGTLYNEDMQFNKALFDPLQY